MVSRLYLPTQGIDFGVTAAPDSAWNVVHSTPFRAGLWPGPNDTPLGNLVLGETFATPVNMMFGQWVGPKMQAQTISGTLGIAFMSQSTLSTGNTYPFAVVRVIKPDGTIRGTLFSGRVGSTVNTALLRLQSAPAVTLTSLAVLAGDRLLVELGCRADNVVTTSNNTTVQFGAPTVESDLGLVAGASSGKPWIEFSSTLLFNDEAVVAWELAEVLATVDPNSRITTQVMEVLGVQVPVQSTVFAAFAEVMGLQKPVESAIAGMLVELIGPPGSPPPEYNLLFVDGTPVQVKFPGLGWVPITTIDDV